MFGCFYLFSFILYGGPQGQCSDVYSSAGMFAPVQQCLFQCRIGHPGATMFVPVQD